MFLSQTFELCLTNLYQTDNKLKQIPTNAKIHLPDKANLLPNLELAVQIHDRQLGITFSIGNHYNGGNLELIIAELNKYLEALQSQTNLQELLIVSGSEQRKIDTLDILTYLEKQTNLQEKNLCISVAYNCNSQDQKLENTRLVAKLSHSMVQKVYIQITDDLPKIITGIEFIRSLNPEIIVSVCVFEPTPSTLSKFKFRPWKGVVLSQKFLLNSDNARQINQHNFTELESLNVETIHTI